MIAHDLKRTVTRRFGLEPHVTYACLGCDFTVTDNGREAKAAWLRHLLNAKRDLEVKG